jgi:hypothetical protein
LSAFIGERKQGDDAGHQVLNTDLVECCDLILKPNVAATEVCYDFFFLAALAFEGDAAISLKVASHLSIMVFS